MTLAQAAGLGALAGLTIFLGLPVARIGRPRPSRLAFLTAASVGVLIFLFFDVISNASGTIETAIDANRGTGIGYGLLLAAGLAVGSLGLVVFERLMKRRPSSMPSGPGALAAAAVGQPAAARRGRTALSAAQRVAFFIAVGIGLHNFSEGLAIGQSAADGAYRLFLVLVIGFGLHNITEGFGITAPLFGERPTWGVLGLLGLIGGGPTFVGTLIGYATGGGHPAVSVLFLALAAGAILYVIGELQHAGRKIGAHDVAMVGLLCGFLVAYGTDLVLHAAGA